MHVCLDQFQFKRSTKIIDLFRPSSTGIEHFCGMISKYANNIVIVKNLAWVRISAPLAWIYLAGWSFFHWQSGWQWTKAQRLKRCTYYLLIFWARESSVRCLCELISTSGRKKTHTNDKRMNSTEIAPNIFFFEIFCLSTTFRKDKLLTHWNCTFR